MSDLISRNDVLALLAQRVEDGYSLDLEAITLSILDLPGAELATDLQHCNNLQHVSGDLISRAALIDALELTDWFHIHGGKLKPGAENQSEALYKADDVFRVVEDLPSSEKRGKWIIKNGVQYAPKAEQGCVKVIKVQCSSCGWRMYLTDSKEQAWNYCPNCGSNNWARMGEA